MGKMVYLKNASTLALDESSCSGCGMCLVVCPHGVFERTDGKARVVGLDHCMECGACALNCPESAIRVQTGVGCAAAVIGSALGANITGCSCSIEPGAESDPDSRNNSCCC